jgi:trehalose-6-phosphatase
MSALKVLSEDPNNAVMVVTGLTKMKLGDTFKDFPNLTIVTSNGLVYSWGENMKEDAIDEALREPDAGAGVMEGIGADSTGRQWGCLDFNIDWQAVRAIANPIITKFTYRTNGTCQSPRIPGIGWSYFGADPDWGSKQVKLLTIELEAALANFDVKIVSQIQGSIEIVPSALHKGIFVKKFIHRVLEKRGGKFPPFCMIMGDETSDDYMHVALHKHISRAKVSACVGDMKAFTVNVGRRQTPADLYAYNVTDVEELISRLSDVTSLEQQQHRNQNEEGMAMVEDIDGVDAS